MTSSHAELILRRLNSQEPKTKVILEIDFQMPEQIMLFFNNDCASLHTLYEGNSLPPTFSSPQHLFCYFCVIAILNWVR